MNNRKSNAVSCASLEKKGTPRSLRTARLQRRRRGCCVLTAVLIIGICAVLTAVPARARLAPLHTSRFAETWREEKAPVFPTVSEARGRILYSAVKTASGEGLGHAMATINGDVSTALLLGVAYSHRKARHGSLTKRDEDAVERFFGWGAEQIPREKLAEVCGVKGVGKGECIPCRIQGGGRWEMGRIKKVVEVPVNLSYTYYARPREIREKMVSEYLTRWNADDTLFQMAVEVCKRSPALSRFTSDSRAYFHRMYWNARLKEPARPRLDERELVIAVHARRGDFFIARRPMVSMRAFGRGIRTLMGVIRERGGIFSRMKVGIIVYSEGVPTNGGWKGHDISRTHAEFLDVQGRKRDAEWVRNQLVANSLHLFPAGIRVEMRVATDTLTAAHEMIAADIFFGSMSGLSTNVVASLSRAGVVALPGRDKERWEAHLGFDPDDGGFYDLKAVRNAWFHYADRYAVHAARALLFGRVHTMAA